MNQNDLFYSNVVRDVEYYESTHYKEALPNDSIERITQILSTLGLKFKEKWYNTDSDDIFSVRITLDETEIGQNGKGVSKEFAKASALAEFLERCQNNYLLYNLWGYTAKNNRCRFVLYPDEKFLTLHEYIARMDPWLKGFLCTHNIQPMDSGENVINFFNEIGFNDCIRYRDSGVMCLPYISQRDGHRYYLPFHKLVALNGSNGMCAGNTKEEALVQGISEIFERYVQKTLLLFPTTLPDVSEDYLSNYPELFEKIQKVENQGYYKVLLKDASYLVNYPVAVLVIVNLVEHTYGIRFGAHPKFHIAVERCLTECMQGKKLEDFSKFSEIDFGHMHSSYSNMYNSYKIGICRYSSELLLPYAGTKKYVHDNDPNGSNIELYEWASNRILAMGLDVLVRDVSYLGFPSYHVVIPELSDMFPANLSSLILHADNTVNYVSEKWHAGHLNSVEDAEVFLRLLDACASRIGTSSPEYFLSHPSKKGLFKFDKYNKSSSFLAAMCCARIGRWEQCLARLRNLRSVIPPFDFESYQLLSICIMYSDAKVNGVSRDELYHILSITNCNNSLIHEILFELDSHDTRIPFLPIVHCENTNCKDCTMHRFCHIPFENDLQAKLRVRMNEFESFRQNNFGI